VNRQDFYEEYRRQVRRARWYRNACDALEWVVVLGAVLMFLGMGVGFLCFTSETTPLWVSDAVAVSTLSGFMLSILGMLVLCFVKRD
jgi:uncharacterized membrane protein